ncbi:hydrolase [Cellulomonas chitinilytica]|uniref:Hydrolase n=1 Tax=Cellulomonas chitinilytica TaxID=398759 RepID=A0A919NZ98_9CELL|nr:MBL fold metallo-hydrolase [Cellulomonas chitinilytica]GIG20403.1 hydrolase [Cellulomonas chitinilytica]
MQLSTVVAPVFAARCTLVVADHGDCVLVDPGAGVADQVTELVERHGLRPRALLATHGHVDHTWDAAVLSARFDVPFVVHTADAYRLADPFGTLGVLGGRTSPHDPSGPLAQALAAAGIGPSTYVEPARVEELGTAPGMRSDDVALAFGTVKLLARHAPGHTEGSTLYLLDVDGAGPVALTGDVLFAGSIGRTDLPGGDDAEMRRTLREVVAALPPETVVVPGHGPTSDIGTELATNPYLRAAT